MKPMLEHKKADANGETDSGRNMEQNEDSLNDSDENEKSEITGDDDPNIPDSNPNDKAENMDIMEKTVFSVPLEQVVSPEQVESNTPNSKTNGEGENIDGSETNNTDDEIINTSATSAIDSESKSDAESMDKDHAIENENINDTDTICEPKDANNEPTDKETVDNSEPKDKETAEDGDLKDKETAANSEPKDKETVANSEPKDKETVANSEPKDKESVANSEPKDTETAVYGEPNDTETAVGEPKDNKTAANCEPKDKETDTMSGQKSDGIGENCEPKDKDADANCKHRDNVAGSATNNKTVTDSPVKIKTEPSASETEEQNGVFKIKIENCVHFDPTTMGEATTDGSTISSSVATENVLNVGKIVQCKIEPRAVKTEQEESASQETQASTIITFKKVRASRKIKPEKSIPEETIELSTDSEDDVASNEEHSMLEVAEINFENSAESPVEIDAEDSDAELCIDLVDSDDDVQEDGVWKYGKDISIRNSDVGSSTKKRAADSNQGKFMKKARLSNNEPGLKIVSACTSRQWNEDIPLRTKIALTTTPYSNAKGFRLPSVESRIQKEVQKAALKEIPNTKKVKMMKKTLLRDAKVKRDFHKSLHSSFEVRNEANSLLSDITQANESIVQYLSDDDLNDSDLESEAIEEYEAGNTVKIPCAKCKINFTSTKSFKKHTCISGVKSMPGLFTCTECQERFHSKGHLMNHLATHEPVNKHRRKYTCRFCHIIFSARSLQSKHERTFHPDLMTFECQHCDLNFATRSLRSAHEKEARHGAWHAIPNQDMIDLTARHASGELNQFPHKCELCKRSFSRGSSLMQHMGSVSHRERAEWKEKEEQKIANRIRQETARNSTPATIVKHETD